MITKSDIELLKEYFPTREEFQNELSAMKSDLMDKLDSILKEVLASRQEETLMSHRISNHEDRISILEKTNPAS